MAAAGVTVGSVWLDVLPSMRNFGGELASQAGEAGRRAGEQTGEEMGEGTRSKFSGAVAGIAAVGGLIGAGIAAAVSQSIDISAGRAKLAAQLGLTAQESERYGAIAGQVYSGAYGESLDQVNEAISGVHRNISENLNDADLQTITQGVLNLASTFDADLGGTTAAVGQLMKTGLAPDAKSALDVITVGFQQGIDMSGDFLDVITEYGTQFRKLGINGATATGLLSQGLQAGARDADIVADSLKEFSIRAVDGSKTSAAGFEALGLSAKDMTAQIAQGGPAASAGLQTVLDRLRGMKDPVAQSGAAVALFGTQAEDLGQALFSLNPATAVTALGQVGGAADAMNTTLGETASSKIESFKRTLETTFVTVVGGYVIPIISTLATIVGTVLGPPLAFVGTVLSTAVVPAFQGLVTWLRDSAGWLLPVAAGVGAFVLAVNAASIATAAWGLATSGASFVMGIARGAVLSFQLGVWLLNAAMAANPIGLIVALLVGLVAGIVVAYNTSETFRGVVNAVWEALKVAGAWIGSVFVAIWTDGIVPALQFAGAIFSWLWASVISPVFSFIGAAALFLKDLFLVLVIFPIMLAWEALGALVRLVWDTVVKPTFDFFAAVGLWLWTNVLQPTFAAIGLGWRLLGDGVRWVYEAIIKPNIDFFAAAAVWLWVNVLKPTLDAIGLGWRLLGDGLRWVYDNVVAPMFGIFTSTAETFGGTFARIVDGIKSVWATIQDAFRAPVRFVIETVWNNGIGGLWGKAKALGLPIGDFPRVDLPPGFAAGGRVPGNSAHSRADNILARLTAGEWVMPVDAARYYGAELMDKLRTRAIPAEVLAGFASGGPVTPDEMFGWVRGKVPGARMTSGLRPGDPGYHGRNRAVDLAGPFSMDMRTMLAINRAIAGAFPGSAELIHTQPGAANIKNGRPHTYNAGVRAGHVNHVHWANDGSRQGEGGGGFFGLLRDALAGIYDGAAAGVRSLVEGAFPRRGNFLADLPLNTFEMVNSKVRDFLFGLADKQDSLGVSADVSGITGPVVDQVRAVAARFGWGDGPEWAALHALVNKESGWNPAAANPTSSARGLFQKMTSIHGPAEPTAAGQAMWGLDYIRGRYGSPSRAWAFHRSHNYYDSGGMLPPGWSTVFNGTGKPEPVLTDRQWAAISEGTRGGDSNEFVITSGELEILDDGLVRVVDARLQRVGTALSNGRRA